MAGLTPPYRGTYVNAELASKEIDAEGIISAANSVKAELEGLVSIATSISNAASAITPKALSFGGSDVTASVEEVNNYISSTYEANTGGLDGIIDAATSYYNTKQEQYNEDARIRDQAAIRRAREAAAANN